MDEAGCRLASGRDGEAGAGQERSSGGDGRWAGGGERD